MAPAARTVRRLRLRAPSEAAVRRTARVLEDALRTASLPDAGGRILFIRRLVLGRLAADAQATTVALALEEAVARVGVEWRHGVESGAGAAAAVWFRDPLEAHVALARRVLAGARSDAWYWPLAVPAWNRGLTRGEGVQAIAHSLASRAEAPAALPRWFVELVDAGYGAALATVLREEDAVPLARAAGVRLGAAGLEGDGPGFPRPAIPKDATTRTASAAGGPTAGARQPQARAGATAVHRLIAAMLRAGGDTGVEGQEAISPAGNSRPPEITAETALSGQHSPAESTSSFAAAKVLRNGKQDGPGRQGAAPEPSPGRPGRTAADTATDEWIDGANPRIPQSSEARESRTGAGLPGHARHRTGSTSAGGLLFLLNALERIGYGEWLASQPEWEAQYVVRRVLARLLERLDVPKEDPGWELARIPSPLRTPPRRFVAPSRWRQGLMTGQTPLLEATGDGRGRLYDPSGRLLLGAWSGPCPRSLGRDRREAAPSSRAPGELAEDVVGAWEVALRRWLRRFVGVSVSEVVMRPAAVAVTPTHIDFHFDLASADPRLRRAGLDLDPGWVMWFGRVVAFHYHPRDLS